jgi:hypothetical protein
MMLVLSWIFRVTAAVILLQTLFFKFTGARESVYIFSAIGAEPWGRIGSGVMELIAAALLLYPRTAAIGAALSFAVMSGAIAAHLAVLGVALPAVGDRGELFVLALITLLCSAGTLFLHRHQLPLLGATARS